jgi:hypothetical protein
VGILYDGCRCRPRQFFSFSARIYRLRSGGFSFHAPAYLLAGRVEGDAVKSAKRVDAVPVRPDITYTAKDGEIWFAPKGYKTDGASIPPIFWPIIGFPFTGYYVSAAIIHDVYARPPDRLLHSSLKQTARRTTRP